MNKIPKLRPAYPMLLRHAWLSLLLKPPTITEDDEDEEAAEAGMDSAGEPLPETADKEIAQWVKAAIERKMSGKMAKSEQPALHAAPLDAVPGSPLLTSDQFVSIEASDAASADPEITPNEGVKVADPQLEIQRVESLDFAGEVVPKHEPSSGSNVQAPAVEEINDEESQVS